MGLYRVGKIEYGANISNHLLLPANRSKCIENNSGAIGREFESLRAHQLFSNSDSYNTPRNWEVLPVDFSSRRRMLFKTVAITFSSPIEVLIMR